MARQLLRSFAAASGARPADPASALRYAERLEARQHEGDAVRLFMRQWRVGFAFDPVCRAMLLVAGNRSGASERRSDRHLARRLNSWGLRVRNRRVKFRMGQRSLIAMLKLSVINGWHFTSHGIGRSGS